MDIKCLKESTRRLVTQRNIFLLLSLILSIAVVLLGTLLTQKKERVVLVPLTGASIWIDDKQASQAYIEKLGTYIAELLLNRSPGDVEWKNKAILEHVHPAFYHEIQKVLLKEKEVIQKDNQSYVFQPSKSYSQENPMMYHIEGEALILVEKNGKNPVCTQRETRTYELGFKCQSGKVQLVSLKRGGGCGTS